MLLVCHTEQSLQFPMQLFNMLLQSQHSLNCCGTAWSGAHPVCGLGWMCTSLVYAAAGAKDSGEALPRLCCMTPFACLTDDVTIQADSRLQLLHVLNHTYASTTARFQLDIATFALYM